jgi:hypothetical protein
VSVTKKRGCAAFFPARRGAPLFSLAAGNSWLQATPVVATLFFARLALGELAPPYHAALCTLCTLWCSRGQGLGNFCSGLTVGRSQPLNERMVYRSQVFKVNIHTLATLSTVNDSNELTPLTALQRRRLCSCRSESVHRSAGSCGSEPLAPAVYGRRAGAAASAPESRRPSAAAGWRCPPATLRRRSSTNRPCRYSTPATLHSRTVSHEEPRPL